jgi:hypothetical protein
MFIIRAGEEGAPSWGLPPHGPATRFFLQHSREKGMWGKVNCCCLARVQLSILHPDDGCVVRMRLLSPVLKRRPPLVRLPTATVVAFADETVSATCAPGLRLFGFNGWFSSPVRGRERGPSSGSVCPEAIAVAV